MSDKASGDSLIAQGQKAMLDFVAADLELAFTLLKTAKIDVPLDPNHSRDLLATVEAALATVRGFEPRIMNQEAWSAVNARADQLEASIDKFKASLSGAIAGDEGS